jgi:hypothetical protein
MLMGSVLDITSIATTTTKEYDQQQRATLALAEAHSMRGGSTEANSSVAPLHGGFTPASAAAAAATAAAVAAAKTAAAAIKESTDKWLLESFSRVQFKPASTLQLLWQTHSDLDIFAANDLQEFALASDALQLANSDSRCVYTVCSMWLIRWSMCSNKIVRCLQ